MRYTFRMRLILRLTFVTLVDAAFAIAVAHAAPSPTFSGPDQLDPPPADNGSSDRRPRPDVEGTLGVAPAPEPPAQASREAAARIYRRYPNALSGKAGFGIDTKEMANGSVPTLAMGFDYAFDWNEGRGFEVGADVLSNNRGAVRLGRKYRAGPGLVRPFAKAGVGVDLDPASALAGLITYKGFQARGSVGFEIASGDKFSVRLELEAAASLRSQQAFGFVGGSWEW